MNEIFIPQGSDQTFEVTCKDADGAPIDFSVGYSNVVIVVYNQNKTVFDKFSIVASVGWKTIDITNQAQGRLSFKLLTATTTLATEGKKFFEVRVQKTDGTVGDGNYDVVVTDQYLCTILKSVINPLTLP